MEQKIEGVIVQILKAESGVSKGGKEWTKQDFVIETKEQYPKKVCFTLFGDKTNLLSNLTEGSEVSVSYNIESREFNGKWFHNINCWKIEVIGGQNYNSSVPQSTDVDPKEMSIKDQILDQKANAPIDDEDDGLPF